MLSERVHKGYTLCDSIFVAFWKMENYEELISGCQGLGRVGKKSHVTPQRAQGRLAGEENVLRPDCGAVT